MKIENKLINFFAKMGERLKKNKSIIAKEICDAMLAVENMPRSKKQSVSPHNVEFFNTPIYLFLILYSFKVGEILAR